MSFVLWHKIRIAPADGGGGLLGAVASFAGIGLPLTVTNDVYAGGLALDAEVSVQMGVGGAADTFAITLADLPAALVAQLRAGYPAGGLIATISLGYFDEPLTRFGAGPVMTGRVIAVTTGIGAGGVSRTVIEGQEEAGYKLLKKAARLDRPKNLPRLTLVRDLVQAAEVTLARQSTIPGSVGDVSVCAATTLTALRELADAADVPLVVGDGEVRLGAAVGATPAPVRIDPGLNLVSRLDVQKEDVTPGARRTGDAKPPVRTSLEVTVLGHPGLRPGQVVTVSGLDDVPPGPLRISRVTHAYGAANGYTCTLMLTAVAAGVRVRVPGGVQGVVDRWQDVVTRSREDHPAIDVGEVTAYRPGKDGRHLADLHYGQNPPAGEVTPSVTTTVGTDVELHNKPVASPFAFHQVGLVTPVYPKMRALLAHNRGLVNDAVAAGWIWSEEPRLKPPPNEPGDYWLALPTELDDDGLPTGKGINDLIDATGHRVVQARALHITVGHKSLPDVGTRPEPPDDDTVVIEHHSGTRITINADGEVTIATDRKTLTLTNGQVSMKLDGAKVAIS